MLMTPTSDIGIQIKKRSAGTEALRETSDCLEFIKSPLAVSSAPKKDGKNAT